MKIFDVAIIGGGPVGIFSVFACGMQNLSCCIIDGLSELGGQCISLYPDKKIYDIPAFKEITAKELIQNLKEQIEIFNADIFLNSFVSEIIQDGEFFKIKKNDEIIYARSVILSLGSGIFSQIKLDLPNALALENKKIFYKIDKLEHFQNKTIAIVGAGDSALDYAIELSKVAKKIILIHRRDFIKGHNYSFNIIKELKNVELKIPYTIHDLGENYIELKHFENAEIIKEYYDYLIPCLGIKANISFLANWNLALNRTKIIVNPTTMQTNLEKIYAIGDCVYYENKRNLIATGFSESMQCAFDIFKTLNPGVAPKIEHSTNKDIFNKRF